MNTAQEFTYSPKSMVDDFGRVFFHEGRVFRKINPSNKEYCLELLNSPLFKELMENRLIPETKITDEFSHKTDALILEHEKLIETLQHEWSFQMFKDAALMILNINAICNKYGYELKDAHTMNVLFDNCKPYFVDIGSISKKTNTTDPWIAYEEFFNCYIVPLLFWSKNQHYIVRKLVESNFYRMFTIPSQPIENSGLYSLLNLDDSHVEYKINRRIIITTKKQNKIFNIGVKLSNILLKKILKIKKYNVSYHQINKKITDILPYKTIGQTIDSLQKPNSTSLWEGYHNKFYNDFGQIDMSKRFRRLLEIISEKKDISSVTDIAGNEGYFSYLLSQKENYSQLILIDYDENAVDKAYLNFKENAVNINPFLVNFMFTLDTEGTAKRLKSDLAIALAVTHHLILTGKFALPTILERVASYSNKYVLIEFMPLGLWSIEHQTKQNLPEWYTLEWFRTAFIEKFDLIKEEQVEENRIAFFGKLK